MKNVLLILLMVLLVGCGQTNNANQQSSQLPAMPAGNSAAAGADGAKEFTMVARQWAFEPNTITVNKGDKVRITMTSADVEHGFSLPEFNIDQKLMPNKPAVVEFTADKTGTFTFRCNVPCGQGHMGMTGTVVVN